jgi:hypothetical protein
LLVLEVSHLGVESVELGTYVEAACTRFVAISDVERTVSIDAQKWASVLDVQL